MTSKTWWLFGLTKVENHNGIGVVCDSAAFDGSESLQIGGCSARIGRFQNKFCLKTKQNYVNNIYSIARYV